MQYQPIARGLASLLKLVKKDLDSVLRKLQAMQGLTGDRFCQDMQNGMFGLFTDVSPVLYELEWKPGPYRPDLWV